MDRESGDVTPALRQSTPEQNKRVNDVCTGWADRVAERMHINKYSVYLAILILAFFIFHMVKNSFMGLQVDEANWWMQTQHLQAGYFFHPPFIVYELFVITKIFGDSQIALRLGSVFFTIGSLLLIYRIYVELFGDHRWAFYITLVIAILPITDFWLMLAIQDSPFLFFNLLTVLLIWRVLSTGKKNYWYLIGISAGLMLLCKLQSAFLLPGVIFLLLVSKENRKWLRRKEPYLAFAIVVVMFIPSIVWYASHGFEPITYQLSNRVGFLEVGFGDYLYTFTEHIVKEMIALSPVVYLFSIFGLAYSAYLGHAKSKGPDQRYTMLFWLSVPTIVIFTLTGGPANWTIPSHFIALIAAAGVTSMLLARTSRPFLQLHWKSILLIFCIIVPLLMSTFTLMVTVGDHIQNAYKALSETVDEVIESMPPGSVYLASPYYFIPSEVAYYERDRFAGYALLFQVYEHVVIGAGSNDYSPWVKTEELVGKDIIFIDTEKNPDDYNTPVSYWEEKLVPYFEDVEEPVIFSYTKWNNDIRRYYIFKCHGFKGFDASTYSKGEIRDYVENQTSSGEDDDSSVVHMDQNQT